MRLSSKLSLVAILAACTGASLHAQTGTYQLYGNGCTGTGGNPGGPVIPPAYATQWGESNNVYPWGWSDQHYMQAHGAKEVSASTLLVRGLAFRGKPTYATSAVVIPCTVRIGYTKNPARALSTTFASNWSGTPTTGFNGNLNVAASAANTSLTNFATKVPFNTPFVFNPALGNLLWECENRLATRVGLNVYDRVASSTLEIGRMWASGSTNATGTFRAGEGLVMQLTGVGGNANVTMSNTGVPAINKRFQLDLAQARLNSVGILWLGASQLNLSLGAIAPGCSLYCSLDAILGAVSTGTSGGGSITIGLPNNPALVGIQFYNQYAVLDAPANTLGIVLTNGGAGKIGT